MVSSTLALFVRSFRVDARSLQAHLMRLLFVAMILLALAWAQETAAMRGAPGLQLFSWISWLNFALITMAGVGMFATPISEEKEEDSLGLLKMAGISPVALLLGKSTTRMISVLLILAVQFPFILLSITLGGVTLSQVIAMTVALAAYMIFVANLGLACSVYSSTSRKASSIVVACLVVLFIVLPIFSAVVASSRLSPQPGTSLSLSGRMALFLREWIDILLVTNRIGVILGTGFAESPVSAQVIASLLAALGLFTFSWLTFERFTSERHARTWLQKLIASKGGVRRRSSSRRAWELAPAWKDFYFLTGGTRSVVVRLFLYLSLIAMINLFPQIFDGPSSRFSAEFLGGSAMISMTIAAAIELGLYASRVFAEEVRGQTLSLLMMLPSKTGAIAWSKVAGVVPALAPAVGCFMLGAMIHPEGLNKALKELFSESGFWAFLSWYILFLHLAAFLSLYVKWAALPLAVLLIYFFQAAYFLVFANAARGPSDGTAVAVIDMLFGVAGTVALQFGIGLRLEALAGR